MEESKTMMPCGQGVRHAQGQEGEVIKGYQETVGGNEHAILNMGMDEYLQKSNFITLYSLYGFIICNYTSIN